ncbi:hypothetical protein [Caminibacter pacificus]|uniref:FlgN protein n=1 Tax=Caminibacter pacificus TaxID=1424653 RepID=A0AAJ4RC29_9BACT|nr:hypothetical protein [Caminibacter pacificus]QCI28915.1 hypothetical protein C6V80_08010 [Caminibacter pacificus]ROR39506.1 hypothetical protein EDC58_1446 [Caminibacter pacificus]
MLTQKLNDIINVLNQLIEMTTQDIENIKAANHEKVFANTAKKEELAVKFSNLKSEIDNILVSRNKPIEEIFSKEEEILFDEFRNKLSEFHTLHKKFSKLALSVANFYNALMKEIKQESPKIDYKDSQLPKSFLKLKA